MKRKEQGQAIVLIVIALVIMVVMAALIVDGGNAYANRRNAQTAADAAALAAAHEKCVNQVPDGSLQPIVDEYAVVHNKATSATYSVDYSDSFYPKGNIHVETTIISNTFFAKIFNRPTVEVKATASAACFYPSAAENLLPIAWTCTPPVSGSTESCVIKSIPHSIWDQITGSGFNFDVDLLDEGDETTAASYQTDLYGTAGEGKMIYMVMDSASFDPALHCEELNVAGTINCDFDDDGILDVEGGANRGWLLLDGTGASDLTDIMLNGYGEELKLAQWFPGKSGVSNSVFINAHTIKFRISLIPVFNGVCEDVLAEEIPSICATEYKSGDFIKPGTGSVTYYRVPAVAAFVITCVSKGNAEFCPGKDLSGVDHNTSTIEGYFISGYSGGSEITNTGFDLGVYIISLTD